LVEWESVGDNFCRRVGGVMGLSALQLVDFYVVPSFSCVSMFMGGLSKLADRFAGSAIFVGCDLSRRLPSPALRFHSRSMLHNFEYLCVVNIAFP
jgi:hypothetical protein